MFHLCPSVAGFVFHPDRIDPSAAKLADAQLVLARSYHASSWTRLVQACHLIDAIWQDDLDAVREIVTNEPRAQSGVAASAGSRQIARRSGCTVKDRLGFAMRRSKRLEAS